MHPALREPRVGGWSQLRHSCAVGEVGFRFANRVSSARTSLGSLWETAAGGFGQVPVSSWLWGDLLGGLNFRLPLGSVESLGDLVERVFGDLLEVLAAQPLLKAGARPCPSRILRKLQEQQSPLHLHPAPEQGEGLLAPGKELLARPPEKDLQDAPCLLNGDPLAGISVEKQHGQTLESRGIDGQGGDFRKSVASEPQGVFQRDIHMQDLIDQHAYIQLICYQGGWCSKPLCPVLLLAGRTRSSLVFNLEEAADEQPWKGQRCLLALLAPRRTRALHQQQVLRAEVPLPHVLHPEVLQPHAHLQEEEASQAFVVPRAGPVQTMGSLHKACQGLVGNLRRNKDLQDRAGGKTGWFLSRTGLTLFSRDSWEHQLPREAVGEAADQALDAAVCPKGALHP